MPQPKLFNSSTEFFDHVFFVVFNNYFKIKIVGLRRIRTRFVRIEGEHTDHLITTTAQIV